MSYISRRRRGKTKISGQFAPRVIDMLRSAAFRTLSLSEHRILARLEIELADHGGTDNGSLPATFDDFEAYGIHRHSIAPALRALEALGFIEITEKGRAGNGEYRRPNLFRLTYRSSEKEGSTDEWKRFETLEQAEACAEAARKNSKANAGKRTTPGVGKRTTGGISHSAKTATTTPSANSTTTIDISGRGHVCAAA